MQSRFLVKAFVLS
ncbi:Hypothetical protein EIN_228420, partial [Entamoeba invadens IP1]